LPCFIRWRSLARQRVDCPRALQGGQLPDDDPDEQEHEQVHQLAGLSNGQRVARIDEQEVVEHERRDRRQHRTPRARCDRSGDDGHEVER
jgi:hypothetical protein